MNDRGGEWTIMPTTCGRYLWDELVVVVENNCGDLIASTEFYADTPAEIDRMLRAEYCDAGMPVPDLPWLLVGDCYAEGCGCTTGWDVNHGGEHIPDAVDIFIDTLKNGGTLQHCVHDEWCDCNLEQITVGYLLRARNFRIKTK